MEVYIDGKEMTWDEWIEYLFEFQMKGMISVANLTYRGLKGSIKECNIEVPDGFNHSKIIQVYSGKLLGIPEDIFYEAGTLADLKEDFKKEVDKYLGVKK